MIGELLIRTASDAASTKLRALVESRPKTMVLMGLGVGLLVGATVPPAKIVRLGFALYPLFKAGAI